MHQPLDRPLVDQVQNLPRNKDCLGCRIVGSSTFAAVGTYALWQSRARAPGTLTQKSSMGGLGIGEESTLRQTLLYNRTIIALLAGSVIRWYQCVCIYIMIEHDRFGELILHRVLPIHENSTLRYE